MISSHFSRDSRILRDRINRLPILLILIFLSGDITSGQELIFDFSHNRETYTWSDSLVYEPEFLGEKRFLFTNTSRSTLIKESILLDRKDRWQENYRTLFEFRVRDHEEPGQFGLATFLQNQYSSFEDRLVSENIIGLSGSISPVNGLYLKNSGAFSTTVRDNAGKKHRANGYNNVLTASYDRRLAPRTIVSLDLKQDMLLVPDIPTNYLEGRSLFQSLGDTDTIRVRLDGSFQNNKYFTSTRSFESISRQQRTTANANLAVSLEPLAKTHVWLTSAFDFREFRYEHYGQSDTRSGLLGSDNDTRTIDYRLTAARRLFEKIEISSHYMYRESNEDYGDLGAKQKIKTGEFSVGLDAGDLIIDSIWAGATFSVTGYFSERVSSFFSDRDRIMELFKMGAKHRMSPHLTVRIDGSYRDFHQTYVSGALSANNNHSEVYVVQPSVEIRPYRWLSIVNRFLLHANYIWYDYEKNVSSERNTLFRRASWISDYNIKVSRRLTLQPSYTYKFEDFGQLLWRDQWVQRTNWDRKAHLPALEFSYRLFRAVELNPGVSYEWKKSWEFVLSEVGTIERVDKETFERTTVFIGLEYNPRPSTRITMSALRRIQKSDLYSDDTTNQFVVNIQRRF